MTQEVISQNGGEVRMLLLNKSVDWSILNAGVTIPVRFHQTLNAVIGSSIKRGEKRIIKVRLDGKIYGIQLTNIEFDQIKYPDHSDIIQFRWSRNSDFAKKLRQIFRISYNYLSKYRTLKHQTGIDKPMIRESITFIMNLQDKIIDIEYVSEDDFQIAREQMSRVNEDEFEYQQNYHRVDTTSSIHYRESIVKIRRIDRTIISDLKQLYDHHCQICGTCFEKYDIRFSEAHHIDHFVHSMNNDSDNILIVCPNHHRVIHSATPEFHYNGQFFIYPNGLKETLMINKHIGTENIGDINARI